MAEAIEAVEEGGREEGEEVGAGANEAGSDTAMHAQTTLGVEEEAQITARGLTFSKILPKALETHSHITPASLQLLHTPLAPT